MWGMATSICLLYHGEERLYFFFIHLIGASPPSPHPPSYGGRAAKKESNIYMWQTVKLMSNDIFYD